ncbi:hypothetical protein ERX46_13610 [Brumimicrobium glaciale]|uniref:10-bladed beta-propeller domain-containing protein n=1 Tax=Brumimicrobium glaciale TaxID=200475 RepID=A0A4Q4KI49_9FLAO|nr:hypothetical protein [Brumimicrobium glaciale]RYM32317.1 hypothetical protein ERX46_13610 [Brumimicrobium glaciale]
MIQKGSLLILILISFQLNAQRVFPLLDNRDYFKSFHEGQTRQLDYLKPIDYKYSEEIIAFIDNKSDLNVYDGREKEKLTGLANDYKLGMNMVAWNTGPIVSVWDNGRTVTLTRFGRDYEVSDSLVVFEDRRDNAVRVYYKGEIHDLYYSISDVYLPQYIGSNTVAFRGNGDVHYAFIGGKIVELGVFNDQIEFAAGANLVAFNDPFNQSFAVAFRNQVLDVEPTMVKSYKAGYDQFVYTDRNGNLKAYIDGGLTTLSSFPNFYEVFRDMVVWGENGVLYTYNNGTRYEIANYIPDEYKIRAGIVAFRNLNGGVSVFHNNQVEIVSNLTGAPFEVNGNTVRVQVSRGNYVFFKNGFTYQE